MSLIPIVSSKHQRQEIVSYAGGNANNIVDCYIGQGPGSEQAIATNVPAGQKVFSIDISVNYINGSASVNTSWAWMLVHLREDQTVAGLFAASSAPDWTTIGLSNGRNQVLKSFIGVMTPNDGGALLHNIHVKIPKMWHRVREGDRLQVVWTSDQAGTLNIGCRYKAYA